MHQVGPSFGKHRYCISLYVLLPITSLLDGQASIGSSVVCDVFDFLSSSHHRLSMRLTKLKTDLLDLT